MLMVSCDGRALARADGTACELVIGAPDAAAASTRQSSGKKKKNNEEEIHKSRVPGVGQTRGVAQKVTLLHQTFLPLCQGECGTVRGFKAAKSTHIFFCLPFRITGQRQEVKSRQCFAKEKLFWRHTHLERRKKLGRPSREFWPQTRLRCRAAKPSARAAAPPRLRRTARPAPEARGTSRSASLRSAATLCQEL